MPAPATSFHPCSPSSSSVREQTSTGPKIIDVEYVLNVLSRPSELKLLHTPEEGPAYVIGDKETNLVEKAAHVVEYRLPVWARQR